MDQQADEVAVLCSIYPDDVLVKDENSLEVHVSVMLPSTSIVVKCPHQSVPLVSSSSPPSSPSFPSSPSSPSSSSSSSSPLSTPSPAVPEDASCEVIALPPIILSTTYHPDYPEKDPPMFTLYSPWLSRPQLSKLCVKMDEIWAEAKGEVVIFRWINWLQEEALSYLGITSSYILPITNNESRESDDIDARTQSDCDPFTIGLIIDYDRRARNDLFRKTEHTCSICYMEYVGSQFVQLSTCKHFFCRDCMQQMFGVHIRSGSVDLMKCPEKGCQQQVMPHEVRELVTQEQYQRYEKLVLDRSLNSMEDVLWCPHCSTAVILDVPNNLGACTKCMFSFCSLCLASWHPGNPCVSSAGALEAMKKRAPSGRREEIEKYRQELDSLQWMASNAKVCPRCKTVIEKTEGCNKMTCIKCGSYFCWQCNSAIGGYEHFRLGKCQLFTDPVYPLYHLPKERFTMVRYHGGEGNNGNADNNANQNNRPNNMFRVNRAVANRIWLQIMQVENPAAVKKCPRCKNNVAKEQNNNHIVCWNCQTQFCFICMQLIYGTLHFLKGKCKQHS